MNHIQEPAAWPYAGHSTRRAGGVQWLFLVHCSLSLRACKLPCQQAKVTSKVTSRAFRPACVPSSFFYPWAVLGLLQVLLVLRLVPGSPLLPVPGGHHCLLTTYRVPDTAASWCHDL
jgi:hypothetical protein